MGGWVDIPLGLTTYQPRSSTQAMHRLRNFYPEISEQGGKTRATLYPTPGLSLFGTYGSGPGRGIYAFGKDLFLVSGDELYAIDIASATGTFLGTIAGSGRVAMIDNGSHVGIGTTADAYAATNSVLISLPESKLTTNTYQDGYVIWGQATTENFWLSGLDDLTTIGATDFSTADAFADKLVAVISDHRELLLMGEKTIEGWANTGNAAFPFERIQGAFMERGCGSAGSAAKADNLVYWQGDDRVIYRASGYQPQDISGPGIAQLVASANSPSTSNAFVYEQSGHTFYCLLFSDLCLVFDTKSGQWHERKSQSMDRWRVSGHTTHNQINYCCDYSNGNVYKMDLATYSENGAEIEREVILPPISNGAERVFVPEMFVDIQAGVGLTTGQGSAPVLTLDWSDDDGRTWAGAQTASLGAIGEYRARATFRRLGSFTNRLFRLRVSDPVNTTILGAQARLDSSG